MDPDDTLLGYGHPQIPDITNGEHSGELVRDKKANAIRRAGVVQIWSYETGSVVKSFELTDVPVRAGRFIARKNWFVAGSDDFQLRAYNYYTSEKVTSFEVRRHRRGEWHCGG